MSEFQLSLLAIGLIVVAGVYLYGFWQQWRYRRSLGDAFKPSAGDPSAQAAPAKIDPAEAGDPLEEEFPNESISPPTGDVCGLLNDATDYVVTLLLKTPITPAILETLWQRRFDFGKTVLACGLNTHSGLWERLIPESEQTYRAFRIGLQLVDRAGSVSEMRLAGFRDLLGDIAGQLQVELKLPSVEEAVKRAQELDRFCADVDQMIGINLLTSGDRKLFGTEVSNAAGRLGMGLQSDGAFHLLDENGETLFSLGASDGGPFQHHTLNQSRVDSLTLLLDIPRVADPVRRFEQMVALAQELARTLRASMADDQRVALSDGAIAQIRAQVAATEKLMLAGQITPGSAQALRLFS
ncbi:cell division protein ZipA [Sideroxyarcus emersonii]|uniref:Cell division protein ZipA n=1 Tax=Sideroxyarcus emersonii TaxID=2764705 RepID=A0AAN1XAT2_9PROT|nr:cell division protein ZipA C-terminal FtsZ-binding domain-containing protein [Sideroxyarcus emersonii]BCK87889.1 cell division protein ZipA [Sideroxyarcus emersonii]